MGLLLSGPLSGLAWGSGFAFNETAARDLGQAFSGHLVDAATAATVSDNPAGMALLAGPVFSAGVGLIDAHAVIRDSQGRVGVSNIDGSNRGDMVPLVSVPFGYYAQPVGERWAVGFGVYVPFGLITDYENHFQGRYFGTRSELRVVAAQPSVAYRFADGWSIGAGATFNRIAANIDKAIYNSLDASRDIDAGFSGADTAWGFNVGLLYELDKNTRVGLGYYSRVRYELRGHTTLDGLPALANIGTSQRYDASLVLTTPDRIDMGFSHAPTDALTLYVDATQTRWSRFSELTVDNDNAPMQPIDLSHSTEQFQWRDAWCYAVGASYRLNDQWLLRAGVAFDASPIPDATRSVRVPISDRTLVGIGATWNATAAFSVDVSYLYLNERGASIDREEPAPIGGTAIHYSARFENTANIFGLQFNWRL